MDRHELDSVDSSPLVDDASMLIQLFDSWRNSLDRSCVDLVSALKAEAAEDRSQSADSMASLTLTSEAMFSVLAASKTVIDAIPDLIWLKDHTGRYLACNQSFQDFLGFSEAQILHQSDFELWPSEIAENQQKRDQQAINQFKPSIVEGWVNLRRDGQQRFLETTLLPIYDRNQKNIGLLGVGRDLTSRRIAEERLQLSEERFSLAMRGANDGLWDWNLETDEVYYSPRWKNMLGYGDSELANELETWKSLVHPEDKDRILKQVDEYVADQSGSFEAEMRMRHKAGHHVYILSRAFLVHSESDGQAIRLVGTHVDMTARKQEEVFDAKNAEILEMIATGKPASDIYTEIALLYESRHPGLRCSMLELQDGHLLHGGAPSLPREYCQAVHGLKNGPSVGSCGTATFTGKRVLVENIETDPKWAKIKHVALPHGMRCCWSEPIKASSGQVLGAFGMYYNHPALPNEEESQDLKSAARIAGIVMERDHAQKRIRELAYVDELTGLSSRQHFYETIDAAIQRADQENSSFALLYIDLDDFKSVNDSLGHDAGDFLLKEIAQRLRSVASSTDFVARLSGDEFCLLMTELNEENSASLVAQRCLHRISEPVELFTRKFTPACSVGIANYPQDGKDAATIIKAADTSLYAAKGRGKNQYAFYHPELTEKAEYRFRVEQSLREAIEHQQLSLAYQPQVDIRTGQIIGVEALSRWHDPQLGQVSPLEFIPTAERIGMIKPLTEWALRTACLQAVAWKKAGLPSIRMAVNISPVCFLDLDFVPLIQQVLDETGMTPAELELEITESVVQTNPQNLSVFNELRQLGVLLAIDDFGTGYSSFASLKHLTVDCLKIDKYFIDDMMIDPKSKMLVSSMIEMGRNLAYGIIAEGVEIPEQIQLLQEMGCEASQGYFHSRPTTPDELEALMRQKLISKS